jgi:hypothetical protein
MGERLSTSNNWAERSKYVLAKASKSMEELKDKQARDNTSLGIFRPKRIMDVVVSVAEPDWKPGFKAALAQSRFWENRTASREPLRKVPFKFQYRFECDDARCKGNHKMMIEDWEAGALYWKCVDEGASAVEAVRKVKQKFLDEICAAENDTHFYVGTVFAHPKSWVIIGVYYPKKHCQQRLPDPSLFDSL